MESQFESSAVCNRFMLIREDAVTRHNASFRVSEFTQPKHNIDPGQARSDKSNRRRDSILHKFRLCIVAIQTRIGRALVIPWKRSWIEVSGCQNDQVAPGPHPPSNVSTAPESRRRTSTTVADLLFDHRASSMPAEIDVLSKYLARGAKGLRRSRPPILTKPT